MAAMTAKEKVEKLLGEKIKCTLEDGRIVCGSLIVLDRKKNLILVNAVEERVVACSDYSDTNNGEVIVTRELSQVMIPGERLTRIEIAQPLFDSAL
jgi:small nuclear ribonucleoprotein (snRNP)-like protein